TTANGGSPWCAKRDALNARYIHPGPAGIAGQRRIEDCELPQAVGELRICGRGRRVLNRLIEPAEDLFECIVIAFAMAAREVGERTRAWLEQRRIFQD